MTVTHVIKNPLNMGLNRLMIKNGNTIATKDEQ